MAKLHNLLRLLLTVLLPDVHSENTAPIGLTVFSIKGGTATLSCANVTPSDCSSATWSYNRNETIAENVTIRAGKTPRSTRLSLLPNCSLHITDIIVEDAGFYTCHQYNNRQKYGKDTTVHLSVLHTSSRQNDDGHHVLFCLLNTNTYCESIVAKKRLNLQWVNEKGVLQNSDNIMIGRVTACGVSLTLKLRDPTVTQRMWRCQLNQGDQVEACVSHTIGQTTTRHTTKIATMTKSTTKRKRKGPRKALENDRSSVSIIPAVLAGFSFYLVVCLIMARLVGSKRTRDRSSGRGVTPRACAGTAVAATYSRANLPVIYVKSSNEGADTVLYSSVNISTNITEPIDDVSNRQSVVVTYADVTTYQQAHPPKSQGEDNVTKADIHIMHND